MTAIEAHTLPQRDRDDGIYFACEQPERYDDDTAFHDGCRACVVALGAAARQYPDLQRTYCTDNGRPVRSVTLSEAYERCRVLHDLPPLPERAS